MNLYWIYPMNLYYILWFCIAYCNLRKNILRPVKPYQLFFTLDLMSSQYISYGIIFWLVKKYCIKLNNNLSYESVLNYALEVLTNEKLHSTKLELCLNSDPPQYVSEFRVVENLWTWNKLCYSTVNYLGQAIQNHLINSSFYYWSIRQNHYYLMNKIWVCLIQNRWKGCNIISRDAHGMQYGFIRPRNVLYEFITWIMNTNS